MLLFDRPAVDAIPLVLVGAKPLRDYRRVFVVFAGKGEIDPPIAPLVSSSRHFGEQHDRRSRVPIFRQYEYAFY